MADVLRLETVRTAAELSSIGADAWDALVRAAPRPSPFMLHDWLVAWWAHHGDGAELAVQVAYRGESLVGALPLFVHRRYGIRLLEFLGGSQSALADALVAEGEGDVAPALVERARATPHDFADLFGVSGDAALARAAARDLRLVERVEAPVLELGGDWRGVYNAKTSSKKRNLHKRRRRQLAELGELAAVRARTLDELEPALDDAFRLHELRWSGRPDRSGFATPVGKRFHRDALRALAARDIPRIVTLTVGGRPVAFHYYFALWGRMYVHRLAFDPAFARFSPGLVNTLDALEWAGDEGLDRVEFLGGDERYKVELADRLEPLHQGLGLAGSPLGEAVVAARLRTIALRRSLKRSPMLRRFYFEGLAPARRALGRRRRSSAST